MKILLIALGVVLVFWIISWIITSADKRRKEKEILERQQKKLEEEKAKEEANKPPWA
jgi:type VI protein secretion system component VasK